MANPEHVAAVRLGGQAFNEWRSWSTEVDLSGADLAGANLSGINLYKANLRGARLCRADRVPYENDLPNDPPGAMQWFYSTEVGQKVGDLIEIVRIEQGESDSRYSLPDPFIVHCTLAQAAKLVNARLDEADGREADLSHAVMRGADLRKAKLDDAILRHVDLTGAKLDEASLTGADLEGARLTAATLSGANLQRVNARGAKLERVDMTDADLSGATLAGADLTGVTAWRVGLTGADLTNADLGSAHLYEASLVGARLREANLELANLVGASVAGADLSGCRAYGVSAWSLEGEALPGAGLVITKRGDVAITTDSLRVAQFIHVMLHSEDVREVIDTITSKVVLILGRFTQERKAVLDALRAELRVFDLTPVLFDFDVPRDRDITETVTLLARMARFVIADLTDPRSIPQEIQAIAPDVAVPIQPVVLAGQEPWAMFADLRRKYHWVLEPYEYADQDSLVAALADVIRPAEAKRRELAGRAGGG